MATGPGKAAVPWIPSVPGEVPTLGYDLIDWITDHLNTPAGTGEPLSLTLEQEDFILRWYSLNPETGRFVYPRGLIGRPRGWGKALALDTLLPTPTGWTTIADAQVGDRLLNAAGTPCTIRAKSQVWEVDSYRVRFSDDPDGLVASGNHLWVVRDRYRTSPEVLTTTQLIERGVELPTNRGWRERRFSVSMTGPLDLPEASLPIDPYVLGVWLGDGDSDCGRITCHPDDYEIIQRLESAGYSVTRQQRYRWGVSRAGAVRGGRNGVPSLASELRAAGLIGNKHIPGQYLRASLKQRLSLLQGLMDTDGSVYDKGVCELTTASLTVKVGVEELLASLGIKFGTYESDAKIDGRTCGTKWRIKFTAHADTPVFRLRRKVERMRPATDARTPSQTRRIIGIEPVPTVDTQCIEVDSEDSTFLAGRRMIPTHNSPLLGALALVEGLAPVLFDGWDADGQPVGRPWSTQVVPLVNVAAVSEEQTRNTWDAILTMCENAPIADLSGFDAMQSMINFPVGAMRRVTSSSRTVKGVPSVFAVLDQTEEWVPSNGGPVLAQTMRTNCAKIGGRTLESPNAFVPGEESVAEASANTYLLGVEGKLRDTEGLVLYDHREAPANTDLTDKDSLVAGLRYAYGCSSDHPDGCVLHDPPCAPGWSPIESNARMFLDPANDVQQLRTDFLNQITHASDAWLSKPDWMARQDLDKVVGEREPVVLGFDGSRGRSRGNADATALIGCRVSDGHFFTIRVWEPPPGRAFNRDWVSPVVEVDAEVRASFERWNVVGFFADPSGWDVHVAEWEAKYGRRLPVKASARGEPIAVWPRGKSSGVAPAIEALRRAILSGEMTHDGSPDLMRHVLNARRRQVRGGYLLDKKFAESPEKIDAAYAAVMAWMARTAAISKGFGRASAPVNRKAIFA